jgi:DNA-binding protein YbaB
MDIFKLMKEATAMKSKLTQMEKELKNKIVETDLNGVKIKMNGKMELIELKLSPQLLTENINKIETTIFTAIQQTIKKSQEIMAEETKKITGGINIPGLM